MEICTLSSWHIFRHYILRTGLQCNDMLSSEVKIKNYFSAYESDNLA